MDLQDATDELNRLTNAQDSISSDTIELIPIDDTPINVALRDQIVLQLAWERHSTQCRAFRDALKDLVEFTFAEAVKEEMEGGHKMRGISEAKEFAKCNQKYKASRRLLVEVERLYDEAKGIKETIESRKYVLNNMAQLIIANSKNELI